MRSRMNYANVTASVALFVALGGGAYAATLPRNSVGPRQIAAKAVGPSELKAKSVRRDKLGFTVGEAAGNGTVATDAMTVDPQDGFVDIAGTRLVSEPKDLVGLVHGAVTVTNPADKAGGPVTVTLRLSGGDHLERGSFSETIADGETATLAGSFVCNGLVEGEHPFELQLSVASEVPQPVQLGTRSVDAASFRPIFNPPT